MRRRPEAVFDEANLTASPSEAGDAYSEGFRFSGLLRVAPYCARGGVRVVSMLFLYLRDTVVHVQFC